MLRSKWIAAKREKKRARDRKCKAMLRKYEEELAHDRKRLRKAKYPESRYERFVETYSPFY